MNNDFEMSEEKRQRILNAIEQYSDFDSYEDIVRRKRIKEDARKAEKRRIKVKTMDDLLNKYEDYDISINTELNIVTLNKPIETKYMLQFRAECNSLGYTCEIKGDLTSKITCHNVFLNI